MKLVLQIAGGIVLAIVILMALSVLVAVGPAFGGFLGAVVNAPDFLLVLSLIFAVIGAVAYSRTRRRSRS